MDNYLFMSYTVETHKTETDLRNGSFNGILNFFARFGSDNMKNNRI